MNYIEWRYNLSLEIALLEEGEQQTILAYYDELFSDKTEEGYAENEILKAFGSPKDVANELTSGLGTIDNATASEEEKASRKQKFKENFEKFEENFNNKVNAMLSKLGKSIKKFASYVNGKLNQLDDYHKSKDKDNEK
ncbi:MAG: DUF1700 domain-containing protein [Bacillota bacterium]